MEGTVHSEEKGKVKEFTITYGNFTLIRPEISGHNPSGKNQDIGKGTNRNLANG